MTIRVFEEGKEPTDIRMVQTILEHRYGLYNPHSALCFLTTDKTFEYPRETKWEVVEAGLDPYFYDAKGNRIDSRFAPPAPPRHISRASSSGLQSIGGPKEKRMKNCMFCSKLTHNIENICNGCLGIPR